MTTTEGRTWQSNEVMNKLVVVAGSIGEIDSLWRSGGSEESVITTALLVQVL